MKVAVISTPKILNGPAGMIPSSVLPDTLTAYNMSEPDNDSLEIEMYGQVVSHIPTDWDGNPVEGLFIALDSFLKDLDLYKAKKNITVRINSVGGELYAGIAICNRLKELPGNVTTICDALAASAASIIFQGGDNRLVYPGSQVMVHGASSFLFGSYNLADIAKVSNTLKGANKAALETYVARTGRTKDFIQNLMNKETWMSGQEAIDNGFADGFVEAEDNVKLTMSADHKIIYSNGIPMPAMGLNVPDNIPVMAVPAPETSKVTSEATSSVVIENNNNPTGGKAKMTLEELMQTDPELVNQIRNDAVTQAQATNTTAVTDAVAAERARIQAIESIQNSIGDKKLIADAKYGEKPMTAQELAFQALQAQAAVGAQVVTDMGKDAEASGVNNVTAVPVATDSSAEDIANGAALIAGVIAQQKEGN